MLENKRWYKYGIDVFKRLCKSNKKYDLEKLIQERKKLLSSIEYFEKIILQKMKIVRIFILQS